MFVYLQSFFLVILEAACCKIFFETFGKKRYESGRLKNYILFTGWIASVYLAAMVTEDVFFFHKTGSGYPIDRGIYGSVFGNRLCKDIYFGCVVSGGIVSGRLLRSLILYFCISPYAAVGRIL